MDWPKEKKKRPETFWILGAGKFGQRATRGLLAKNPGMEIILVDSDPEALLPFEGEARVRTICRDALSYLVENLVPGAPDLPDWIVPAVPVHAAYEFVKAKLEQEGGVEALPVPETMAAGAPNPMSGPDGALYASVADFYCPPDCPEPATHCTATGRPRAANLFDTLKGLVPEDALSVVVRSRQLLPGVGGYRPGDLVSALEEARRAGGKTVCLATACRCHGVAHAFRRV